MKDSPFIYGTTVSTQAFTNREEESAKLKANLLNGINTTIISPRRWGKSSLVEKVIHDIKRSEKSRKTVVIDLFSVGTEAEFLELFTREVIKASSSKWQEWLQSGKNFFRKVTPQLTVGLDPVSDFNVRFETKELKKNTDEILNLPETIAKEKGIKFIICLDEFQNLAHFPNYHAFEKKMRACWQRQKLVTYCTYGSKRHMMNDIFNNPSAPFYRFGDLMMLPRIHSKKWVSFITKSFINSGKHIEPEAAALIPELMKNHSWYVQQLAHYTWNISKRKATVHDVYQALKELVYTNIPFYQKEAENISRTQLNFMKAVANGESRFTSVAVMDEFQLGTPRNASKNKTMLVNNDIIQEENGQYQFLDPAFELWFRMQYMGEKLPGSK